MTLSGGRLDVIAFSSSTGVERTSEHVGVRLVAIDDLDSAICPELPPRGREQGLWRCCSCDWNFSLLPFL